MKTKFIFLLFTMCFFCTYTVSAQGSILDVAKKEDQKVADRNARMGRPTNNNSNNNNNMSGDELEYFETWKQILGQQMLELKEGLSYFDTRETACFYTMIIYLDAYFDLEDEIKETNDCKKKSGLLTMQSMAIGSSTLIMYCPEGIYNSTDEELDVLDDDLSDILFNHRDNPIVAKWETKFERVLGRSLDNIQGNDDYPDINTIPRMYREISLYFSPQYIIPAVLVIQQEIEVLGCN